MYVTALLVEKVTSCVKGWSVVNKYHGKCKKTWTDVR